MSGPAPEREAVVAAVLATWLDRDDVSENRAADEVRERSGEVGAAVVAALAAAAHAQDGADPADGLTCWHRFPDGTECRLSRAAHDMPGMKHHSAARQRPTQQGIG